MTIHRSVGRFRYMESEPPVSARSRGALVFLHAFPLNARMWEPQLALAERGWRVIAPHFRGFDGIPAERGQVNAGGAAETSPPVTSIDDYAGDIIDLLDALHIHEAVIVGLSMGGYVAMAMLRHAARYVHALVLADTRPQADTPEGVDARERMLRLAQEKGAAAIADEMLPKLLGETTRRTRPDVVAAVRELVLSNSPAAIRGALRAMMTRPDSTEILSSTRCPTLLIVGDEDTVTPPSIAEAMQRAIAGSELTVVPGSGHLSNLENTDAFNATLSRFLDHRV